MAISPLAGKPAPKEMLVDLSRLEREYFGRRPDVGDPNQLVSFGTSGHRGTPLRDTLLTRGDYYMHLADLVSYLEADERLCALYVDRDAWARTAILNVASSGKFSSDRTIAEYAADIWHVTPCPVA